MSNITFKSPVDLINDEQMKYNQLLHRYEVTKEGYDKNTNTSIVKSEGSDPSADVQVTNLSLLTHMYMFSKIDNADREVLEFRISRDTDLALALKDAMIAFHKSDLITGATKIYYQHGVDTGLSTEALLEAVVPPIVKDILDNNTLLKTRYGFSIPDNVKRVGY